jgi:hypothetical protein
MSNFLQYGPLILALAIVIGIFTLILFGHAVDPFLWGALTLVVGFFYGQHSASQSAALKG